MPMNNNDGQNDKMYNGGTYILGIYYSHQFRVKACSLGGNHIMPSTIKLAYYLLLARSRTLIESLYCYFTKPV